MKHMMGHEYGQSWALAAALLDRPKTLEEIIEHFQVAFRRFGYFSDELHNEEKKIKTELEKLIAKGWIIKEGEKYRLTELGRIEAEKSYSEVKLMRDKIRHKLFSPVCVVRVTIIVHFLMALIKFPAGLLSGSVGLINDAIDTLLDGLASILVYFGIKFDKEYIVNIMLIVVMFFTGITALYQSVRRFFISVETGVDFVTFAAVILSAAISLVLMLYQRYVGLKENNLTLITQSVDSRNHIIVAGGVTGGMIATLFNFYLLDIIVGIAVALLILKGAVELLLEIIKYMNEEEKDLSSYHLDFFNINKKFYRKGLKNWILRRILDQRPTRKKLYQSALMVLDFHDNLTLESIGFNKCPWVPEMINNIIDELIDKGYVDENNILTVTDKGMRQARRHSRHGMKLLNKLRKVFRIVVGLISYMTIYVLFLFALSFLKRFYLWQSIDYTILQINFYFFNRFYDFTLFNFIHLLLGLPLFIYGMNLFWESCQLNRSRGDNNLRSPETLIKTGPYSKVRHPMYGGMALMYIGLFFALKSWLALLIGFFMSILFLVNGWWEEKYELKKHYGKEYLKYMKETNNKYFNGKTKVYLFIIVLISLIGLLY